MEGDNRSDLTADEVFRQIHDILERFRERNEPDPFCFMALGRGGDYTIYGGASIPLLGGLDVAAAEIRSPMLHFRMQEKIKHARAGLSGPDGRPARG